MRYFALIILYAIGNLSASADGPYTKITIGDRVGYVVPKEMAEKSDSEVLKFWLPAYWSQAYIQDITGFWTPGDQDIAEAEIGILKYLEAARANPKVAFDYPTLRPGERKLALLSAQHEVGLVLDNFKNYKAQYVGILVKGRKRILCNYFDLIHLPPGFGLDPSSRIIDVNDGGFMYWHLEYDCVSRTCTQLSINGVWDWDEGIVPHGNQVILAGDWTPTKQQVDKALWAAALHVQARSFKTETTPTDKYQIEGAKTINRQMFRYCVQFVGRTLHGKKVIYCNFFPGPGLNNAIWKEIEPRWQKSQVAVDDGGPNFWQIYYDPETDECSDLQINGPG